MKAASEKAEITKSVCPHLLRHSDAIERLRQTGNPEAIQFHLGHMSMLMTMHYLSTLQQEDALRIQQQVAFEKFAKLLHKKHKRRTEKFYCSFSFN